MAFKFFMRRDAKDKKITTPAAPKAEVKAPEMKPAEVQKVEQKPVAPKPLEHKAEQKSVAETKKDGENVYAFIDASNLFWGGRSSMGFGVDYKKLIEFLAKEYHVTKVFYYGGVRIFDYEYSVLDNELINLTKLEEHLKELQKTAVEKDVVAIERSLSKINFYKILENYGYIMKIKPAKVFYDEDDENEEKPLLKANCDVDMTFDMMRYMQQYTGVVAMTGDGDFASVLSYLKAHDRKLIVFSRWNRTAKEIKTVAGDNFVDFEKLRSVVQQYRR